MSGTDLSQPARRVDYALETTIAEHHIAANLPFRAGVLHGVDLTWFQPDPQPTD